MKTYAASSGKTENEIKKEINETGEKVCVFVCVCMYVCTWHDSRDHRVRK